MNKALKLNKTLKMTLMVSTLLFISLFLFACQRNTLVTFETYGGTEIKEQRIQSLDDIVDPTKEGYTFAGWFPYSNLGGERLTKLPEGKKAVLHAKWILNEYSVTFLLNGGTGQTSKAFSVETESQLQIPVKEGYQFDGWYLDENFTSAKMTHIVKGTKGDMTLYACWIELSSSSIRYELVESQDGYRVIGLTEPTTDLIIPSTYQGKPVVEIEFKGTITASIRSSLKTISIPSSVTSILNIGHPVLSFGFFPNLNSINVSVNNEVFKSVDGVLLSKDQTTLFAYPAGKDNATYQVHDGVEVIFDQAFFGNRFLEEVTIKNSVLSIGDYAFAYNYNLEKVIFEENSNLESIGNFAFLQAWKLTKIDITKYVNEIGNEAFGFTLSLDEIIVNEDNESFRSIDGVLFTKDLSTLIKYPAKKANTLYTVPEGVLNIDVLAFENASYLTKVVFSSSVVEIKKQAFYGANKLAEIEFPLDSALKKIGADAFFGAKLVEVILPSSLESIGNSAFRSNPGLVSVTLTSNAVVTLGIEAFDFTHKDLKIYVNAILLDAYIDAVNWKSIKAKITSIA
jgi:uncharacterized repeat protein (TIGR02543 family)